MVCLRIPSESIRLALQNDTTAFTSNIIKNDFQSY